MNKVLIIEDNRDINAALANILATEGYETNSAYTGTEGLHMIKMQTYDLVLLDITLPYKKGDEILREVRSFSQVPIIIISAKDRISTKIDLLKLGADDYITKPFDLGEVLARVETTLRRYSKQIKANNSFVYKDLVLDCEAKQITVNNHLLSLTAVEYQIMELLVCSKGKIFTKANLYESVWQEEYVGDDNIVKTHISHLRSKLKQANKEQEYIETMWGLGYRLYKD